MRREQLPPGWSWDAEDGPWACHAIGPFPGQGVTVTPGGRLGFGGSINKHERRQVVAACWSPESRRAAAQIALSQCVTRKLSKMAQRVMR
jgi:hypothetical protein